MIVLSVAGVPSLWLEGVTRHADGSIKTGYVVNGDWYFERDGTYVYAKRDPNDSTFVNRWTDPGYSESTDAPPYEDERF
jgi:hypothetical protein